MKEREGGASRAGLKHKQVKGIRKGGEEERRVVVEEKIVKEGERAASIGAFEDKQA